MIEQALYEHLLLQDALEPYLATYDGMPAVFSQEAPADTDSLWGDGPQYGRIVFTIDLQGDPGRIFGGRLVVDIMCKEDEQYPEDIEPILRPLIHGYFFSSGTFTVAAQWVSSDPFTQPTDHVTGCTMAFDLLAFPMITTSAPDVISRINAWTKARFPELHVINLDTLPATAWKPSVGDSAIYWRLGATAPARWIPDTFQTVWRTATIKGHVFSEDIATVADVSERVNIQLYADKRLLKQGETPIMVNRNNTSDVSADPLRTGQITVDATYGVIVYTVPDPGIKNISVKDG